MGVWSADAGADWWILGVEEGFVSEGKTVRWSWWWVWLWCWSRAFCIREFGVGARLGRVMVGNDTLHGFFFGFP